MRWAIPLLLFFFPIIASTEPLKVYQCPSVTDARDCGASCRLMPGKLLKQLSVKADKREVVVITRRDGKVDGITSLRDCFIRDESDWTCPPAPKVFGSDVLLVYQMKNRKLFQFSMVGDVIIQPLCAKRK